MYYGFCNFCRVNEAIHKYLGHPVCFKCVQGIYAVMAAMAMKVECTVIDEKDSTKEKIQG